MPVLIGKIDTFFTGNVHSGVQLHKRSAPMDGYTVNDFENRERLPFDPLNPDDIWKISRDSPVVESVSGVRE